MSVASRHLLKAITARWDEAGLDAEFHAKSSGGASSYVGAVLNDGEAAPGQSWPYCVFEQLSTGGIEARMSGNGDATINRRHQVVPIMFSIYAQRVGSSSAKTIAADLAGHVLNAFGDDENGQHELTLDVGQHVQTQLQNDYGVRQDDEEYQWNVIYEFLIDTPVTVA